MAGTLDELAALSGVSRATVSRVINGGSVSRATRERVLAVIEATNLRPNAAARTLASGRSGVIGVVMHDAPPEVFGDPYFAQLLHGMSDALSEQAAGMMLWLGNRSKEETLDRILWPGSLDGVIVTADNLEDPLVDGLLASDLPTVLVGHRRADRSASYVDVDHVHAAEVVTTHLIDLGRRRIAHVTGRRGTVAGGYRIAGYRRAMERRGLVTDGFNSSKGTSAGARAPRGAIEPARPRRRCRTSAPETPPWLRLAPGRSARAACASHRTSRSRGSTTSSSRPACIRP